MDRESFYIADLHSNYPPVVYSTTQYCVEMDIQDPPNSLLVGNAVNKVIQKERMVYLHRGNPGKFIKIWDKWLNTSEVVPLQLVRERLLGVG